MDIIQVISATPRAGIGRESGRPYNMLVLDVIFHPADAPAFGCELTFMENQNQKIPHVVAGQKYEPITAFRRDQNRRLQCQVVGLKPAVAAVKAA